MATPDSGNPTNLPALTPKVMENGGSVSEILQPVNQIAFVADPTDLATALTAIIAIRDGLVAKGLMLPA